MNYKKICFAQDFYKDYYEDQKMFTNRGVIGLSEGNNKKTPVNCSYATYPACHSVI